MRTNVIVVILVLISGLCLGLILGKQVVFKDCPAKCPKGQVMVTGQGCFTPGIFYTDTTRR